MFSLYILSCFLCMFSFLFVEAFGDSVYHSFWFWFINILSLILLAFCLLFLCLVSFFCFFALSRMLFFIDSYHFFILFFWFVYIFGDFLLFLCVFVSHCLVCVFSLFCVYFIRYTQKCIKLFAFFWELCIM